MPQVIERIQARLFRKIASPASGLSAHLDRLLWLASRAYGGLVAKRRFYYRQGRGHTHVLPCPVISVGNLEVGGTGKTPMTIHLARTLCAMGLRTAILSRGYKGTCSKRGAVVSDGRSLLLNAREAGDEPYLIASLLDQVPVVIGRDRVAAGKSAIRHFNPHILLLDDGYQHYRLHRDLDVVLLDAQRPFGNGFLLPRGRLREPVAALARSHALVLTRSKKAEPDYFQKLQKAIAPRPLFRSFHCEIVRGHIPSGTPLHHDLNKLVLNWSSISEKRCFAFSGLARNEGFYESAAALGCKLSGTMGFGDHHWYCHGDLQCILDAARQSGSDYLVTTDKDLVRIPAHTRLPLTLVVAGVEIDLRDDRQAWHEFIAAFLESATRRHG